MENLKKFAGVTAVRAATTLAANKGHYRDAVEMTKSSDPLVSAYLEKAMIFPTTLGELPLLAAEPVARELGGFVFAQSVPGQLIERAIRLPFGTRLHAISGNGSGWVSESEEIPLTAGNTSSDVFMPHKVAALTVLDNETLRNAPPETNATIRNVIATESAKEIDKKFLSSDEAVDGVSPAGVLCGATEAADLLSMIETHTANGNSLTTSTLILPVRHAMKLMEYEIEEIKLLGLPLIVSQHAGKVAIINAQKLIINVEGTIIKQSNQTQIKTTEGTSLSLFQNGLTAFRAVTYCGWEVLDNAVTVLREGMTA